MLKRYLHTLRDLFFPVICFSCQKKIPAGILCASCQEKISFLKPPLCRRCSLPIKDNSLNYCGSCQGKPAGYHKIISAAIYEEPLSGLIKLFKYRHFDYLGEFLGRLMINHLTHIGFSGQGYDCLVSVPIHRYRLKARGYNQAGILASLLSNHFKIPLRNDIIEVVQYRPQQAKLSKSQRRKNISKMFTADFSAKNLNLLLVDDIFTTGATVSACAKSLKEKGANLITVLTLAKTVGNKNHENNP